MAKLQPHLHLAVRLALGALFLYAGIQKALHLQDTVIAVHGYALAPSILVHPVALGVTLLEIVLGILLLLGLFTRFAAAAVAVLAVLFLAFLVQAKIRGLNIGCGCFGGSGTENGLSWLDLLRDLLVLAAAVYLFLFGPREPFGIDRFIPRARGMEKELNIGGPLILVAAIVAVSLVLPGLTGALDLPQAAAPGQVTVSRAARSAPWPVGSTLPSFSAPGLSGRTVSSGAYAGSPMVLALWAPWCAECRETLPLLAQVASDFPDVRVVSIATAAGELPGPTPEAFAQSHDLNFPVALDSSDERLADAFGVQAYPTIYYVKPDGTISQVTVGATPEATMRAAIETITQ